MRQHKHLLDKFRCATVGGSAAVVAHSNKVLDARTYDKERIAVHAGHRGVSNHNSVLEHCIRGFPAKNLMVEIEEGDEVSLTFTKIFGDGIIISDDDIMNIPPAI